MASRPNVVGLRRLGPTPRVAIADSVSDLGKMQVLRARKRAKAAQRYLQRHPERAAQVHARHVELTGHEPEWTKPDALRQALNDIRRERPRTLRRGKPTLAPVSLPEVEW